MDRASLPFLLVASPAVRQALGADLRKVAVLAIQALIRHRRSLEVSLQQIDYRHVPIAFSSRIGRMGDLILEMDVGDASLSERLFLEKDFRAAEAEAAKARATKPKRR
jgi:hypothetical protein